MPGVESAISSRKGSGLTLRQGGYTKHINQIAELIYIIEGTLPATHQTGNVAGAKLQKHTYFVTDRQSTGKSKTNHPNSSTVRGLSFSLCKYKSRKSTA